MWNADIFIHITEVLQDPTVQSKLSDTKAASEVKALEQFYQILQTEPARAFYGKNHVIRAAESQAIETLLISDNLFRLVYSQLIYRMNSTDEWKIVDKNGENISFVLGVTM